MITLQAKNKQATDLLEVAYYLTNMVRRKTGLISLDPRELLVYFILLVFAIAYGAGLWAQFHPTGLFYLP